MPIAIAATQILLNCLTWSFIMAMRARQTTKIMEMTPVFFIHCGNSWKIKLIPKPVGRIAKTSLPLTILFLQSFCSSWSTPHGDKSFSVLFITESNTASLFERALTAAISHYPICVSYTQVFTKPVKHDQSEGIPDPGRILEQPFVKYAHRCSFASSGHTFFIFLCCRNWTWASTWWATRLKHRG